MGDRYKVTVEEDSGMDFAAWIIVGVLVVACFFAIGIPFLIGYIIYKIYQYNKKQKALAVTQCAKCRKSNALTYVNTEVIKETPKVVTIYSKETKGRTTELKEVIEYTHRKYERCKFCDEISFTDTVKNTP